LAEILIAGLAAGDGGAETKRQGEQQTPTMPSDKAHALLREIRSSCNLILFCHVARAELKGCHHRIYYFSNHFQKQ
jgi:hypothetical protein